MKILFEPEAFKKMRAYVKGIDFEISGFGKVEKRGEDLAIVDIKIFEQVVTSSHTEMNAKALAKFFDDLLVAGEDPVHWKLWWHSHVDMPAFFSGTDYATIDAFDTEEPNENWMLSIVVNKRGEHTTQVDIFQPLRCTIGHLLWQFDKEAIKGEIDVSAEIKEKVQIREIPSYVPPDTIDFSGKQYSSMSLEELQKLLQAKAKEHRNLPLPIHTSPPITIVDGEIVT